MAQVAQLIMPAPNPVTVENKNAKKGELVVKLGKVLPVFSIPKSILIDSSVNDYLSSLSYHLSREKEEHRREESEKDLVLFSFLGEARESREITEAFELKCMHEVSLPYLLGAAEKFPEQLCNDLSRWHSIGLLPTIPFGHLGLRLCLRLHGSGNDRKIQFFKSLMLEKSLYICSYQQQFIT